MNVELIDYTGAGTKDPALHAARVLAFTKSTRLTLDQARRDTIYDMPAEELYEHLEYMANTVPSSWEFVHYTFLISGVSRAFTHQLVRTRTASYAQQAMRVVDMTQAVDCYKGPAIDTVKREAVWAGTIEAVRQGYSTLIEDGVPTEDARGLLPTNIKTNICMSINLRALSDLIIKRSSWRVQSEYRDVVQGLFHETVRVHPWVTMFLRSKKSEAAEFLQDFIVQEADGTVRNELVKALDTLRK